MTTRPALTIKDDQIICQSFEFEWSDGFAFSQKQKNIKAFHNAIKLSTKATALEVSSKGFDPIGTKLSAFKLKINGIYLENIFQSSKKYKNGGPYLDLLEVTPKEAKQDTRHRKSGNLIAFVKDGVEWEIEPKTAFYDYIYVSALLENFGKALDLSAYEWFTDIEFNPNRSINCQARSASIYKLLKKMDAFDVLKDKNEWIKFHIAHIRG